MYRRSQQGVAKDEHKGFLHSDILMATGQSQEHSRGYVLWDITPCLPFTHSFLIVVGQKRGELLWYLVGGSQECSVNILPCTGCPTTNNDPTPNVRSAGVERP